MVVLDLETTGTDVAQDRIVEFCALKISPNGSRETLTRSVKAAIPMSREASEVTGIKDADLQDESPWALVGVLLWQFIDGCDLAGFGLKNFDVPLLWEEFHRIGLSWDLTDTKVIDAGNIFKKKEGRTLSDAVRFYCGREHVGAHGAEADTMATADVLMGQLEKYSDLPRDVGELALYSAYDNRVDLAGKIVLNEDGIPVYGFGKDAGKIISQNPGYGKWMLGEKFPEQTKAVLRKILYGVPPEADEPF
jgi:DNA polymerase-3 subunit epsilon